MSTRAQRLASTQARNQAMRRLREAHPEEYRVLYNEEAVKRGVTPAGAAKELKRARLLRELAALDKPP